jgi:hypothetical protein
LQAIIPLSFTKNDVACAVHCPFFVRFHVGYPFPYVDFAQGLLLRAMAML